MATTIQAYVRALSTNEQAGMGGFTHVAIFGPTTTNLLNDTVADDDITFNLFEAPAGSVMIKWALVLDPAFKDASDAAFNSTAFSFGDAGSASRFLNGVQTNENGTEVIYTYGNTAYVYTAASQLSVLLESMTAKKLSDIDVGKAVLFFQLNQLEDFANAAQI